MAESSNRVKNKSGKTSFEVKSRKTKPGKTSFEVKSGKTMPGKTSFEVKSGKTKSGIVFQDFKEGLLNEITVNFSVELGEGGTARVYRGAQGNTIVATKAYNKTNMRAWEREKEAFEKLGRHPNIVTCFGSGETKDRFCIVMELIRTIKLKGLQIVGQPHSPSPSYSPPPFYDPAWYLNTSASNHMTGNPSLLQQCHPYTGFNSVMLGNGDQM